MNAQRLGRCGKRAASLAPPDTKFLCKGVNGISLSQGENTVFERVSHSAQSKIVQLAV